MVPCVGGCWCPPQSAPGKRHGCPWRQPPGPHSRHLLTAAATFPHSFPAAAIFKGGSRDAAGQIASIACSAHPRCACRLRSTLESRRTTASPRPRGRISAHNSPAHGVVFQASTTRTLAEAAAAGTASARANTEAKQRLAVPHPARGRRVRGVDRDARGSSYVSLSNGRIFWHESHGFYTGKEPSKTQVYEMRLLSDGA
jgi:hypothetical protein